MKTEEKFKQLLKTIFQYSKDKIDLDFGVYKVFKHNEKEIYDFVEKRLPSFLEEQFNKVNIEKNITIEDCYNDILNFFMQYYEGGDFYPAQYFSPHTKKHMLRHNGEEVIFSWANKDQYYIKNLSNFNDYTFEAPKEWFKESLFEQTNTTIHFKMDIENIEELTGSKKDKRNYILLDEKTELNDDGCTVYFGFKEGTAVTSKKLFEHLKEKKINMNSIDEIELHFKKFINVRRSDFFIHKNLYKFLTEELDYYIKSELVDIDKPSTLYRAKVTKTVAEYIIKFLSKLEELQRVLWEKKKFAYDVNYIITLDKINKKLLEKIVKHPNFKKQKDEWVNDLKLINEFDISKLYTDNLLKEINTEYKYLPLDTKHFQDDILKYEILEQFENIDDAIDGILINSDNFHGLNYLQKRFKEKVKCVYIDPPYNTGDNQFAYKDSYQHSSWLSMLQDRIQLMEKLVNEKGRFFCSIDDRENHRLLNLLFDILKEENYLGSITWEKRTKSQNTKTSKYMLQSKIEYIHPFRFNGKRQEFNLEVSGQKIYPEKDKYGKYRIQKAEMDSLDRAHAAESMRYDILGITPPEGKCWKFGIKTKEEYDLENRIFLKDSCPHIIFRPEHESQDKHKPLWSHFFDKEVYGTAERGLDLLDKKLGFGKEFQTVKPIELVKKILFHTTNEDDIVMDFFGGSGTTAHATIELNRENETEKTRKYILMEANDYFEDFLIKRTKKVVFSKDWDNGLPKIYSDIQKQNEKLLKEEDTKKQEKIRKDIQKLNKKLRELNPHNGVSQLIKYYSLEQYEDTLQNTSFSNDKINSKLLTLEKYKDTLPYLYENKFISLAKDISLQQSSSLLLNIKDEFLCDPFNYTLEIYKENKYISTKIDLVETFNTLKGFEINSIKQKFFSLNNKRYLFVDAKKEVIIWREVSKEEINENFIREEEAFIKEHIDTNKKMYMNGINSYYTKAFLDGQADEILYAFRKILMYGVKDGD